MLKRLEHMKESLVACVESQMSGGLKEVDAKELGEAIDMIKDLEEAIYYCTITKTMKENEEEEKYSYKQQSMHQQDGRNGGSNYYTPMYYPPMYNDGAIYDNNFNSGNSNGNNAREYTDMQMARDKREGNSPMRRRMYMEGKEKKYDSTKQMKELEEYMHELSNDIMEMIEDSTPEEKQILRQKITTLATKIK